MEGMKNLFPARMEDVPEEFRLPEFVDQREYLVNGELRVWRGDFQDVISPIGMESQEGSRIGRYPLLTEHEALEALEAARNGEDFYGIPNAWLAKELSEAETVILAQQVVILAKARIY